MWKERKNYCINQFFSGLPDVHKVKKCALPLEILPNRDRKTFLKTKRIREIRLAHMLYLTLLLLYSAENIRLTTVLFSMYTKNSEIFKTNLFFGAVSRTRKWRSFWIEQWLVTRPVAKIIPQWMTLAYTDFRYWLRNATSWILIVDFIENKYHRLGLYSDNITLVLPVQTQGILRKFNLDIFNQATYCTGLDVLIKNCLPTLKCERSDLGHSTLKTNSKQNAVTSALIHYDHSDTLYLGMQNSL